MTWRDFVFDASTNLVVAKPLTPETMARIPDGFRAWAMSAAAEPFRFARRPDRSGWRRVAAGSLAEAVERSIMRVDAVVDFDGLLAIARDRDYTDLAAVLILSTDSVGVSISHRFADGVATLSALEAIFSGRPQVQPRMSSAPILRGLARSGQLSVSGLRHGRSVLREQNAIVAAVPQPAPRKAAAGPAVSEFTLSTARMSELAAAERHVSATGATAARLPTTAVLSGLVFRAARRCLDDGVDLPIGMLVGLRRHLGTGWSTPGNFATGIVAGTLREREWTGAEFDARVLPRLSSSTPMASYAVETLARARGRVFPRGSDLSVGGSRLMFTYNVLPGSIGLARSDYVAGAVPRAGLIMLNRGAPLGPYCTTAATGREFVITTVDESGILDLAGFEAAFRAEEDELLA